MNTFESNSLNANEITSDSIDQSIAAARTALNSSKENALLSSTEN